MLFRAGEKGEVNTIGDAAPATTVFIIMNNLDQTGWAEGHSIVYDAQGSFSNLPLTIPRCHGPKPKQKSATTELIRWAGRCLRKGAHPTKAQLAEGWRLLLTAIEQNGMYKHNHNHPLYRAVRERVAWLNAEREKKTTAGQP